MSSLRDFHNQAMEFTDRAIRERARGERGALLEYFQQALELELAAIDAQ